MSHPSQSSSSFQSLFNAALRDFTNKTRTRLVDHPLTKQLEKCNSVDSIVAVLQQQTRSFSRYRGDDGRIMKSIKPSIQVLYALSTSSILGEAVDISVPPAKAVFAGIGILLGAVKDVAASYDALFELFESFRNLLARLEIYIKFPPDDAAEFGSVFVKIMVELLFALALATKQMKEGRFKRFLNKLMRENKIEGALQKLDRLTQDEGLTIAKQTFQLVHSLGQNMKVVIEDLNRNALPATSKSLREVTQSERDKLRRDIHKWLSPPDPFKNHYLACESKHDKTSTWWIQSDTYAKWKSSSQSSLLWIHGKPGSGKTILCSAIIEDILKMREVGQALLAFFYCDFREDQKDLRGLVSSLLVQLCDQSDPYYAVLSNFYEAHDCGDEYASEAELVQCLSDMVNTPGQATSYIIIDALDEFSETTGLPSPRDKVLKLVEDLVKLRVTNLRICVTSRPEADIKLALEPLCFHSVSLHSEEGQIRDIAEYIRSVVETDHHFQRWKPMDRELVIDEITRRADGMFRWAFCQLVYLRSCMPGRIRHALDELPETLDETYARTLTEISEWNWELAHRLLQCVAVASRPLRVEELAEFLAFDFDSGSTPAFVVERRPEDPAQAVLSTCSSLLSIVDVDGSRAVQFSHYSVKEYLTSSRLANSEQAISRFHVSMTASHTMVAQACLGLLLHFDENITKDRLEKFPLADYVAEYWVHHARFEEVSTKIQDDMRRLFEPREHHMAIWVWIYDPLDGKRKVSERPLECRATPLHYAASCGLRDVVNSLIIERSEDVDVRNSFGRTPLSVACEKGHLEVVLAILEHGADPNAQSDQRWTSLHWASRNGHVDVVRTLLERGADSTTQDNDYWTALHFASQNGHVDVARTLLERGADPNTEGKEKSTSLHFASQNGHVDVARALLECGADPNAQDEDNWTALHMASQNGHVDVARTLLEHGADPNAQDEDNWTPLHFASQNGCVEVARTLFEHGADPNAQDNDNWTPMHLVSQMGHVDFARTLLEHGTNPNAQDKDNWTPLHFASRNGHVNVARTLLEHGVDPNAQNKDNWTPLHFASRNGHVDVALTLLEHRADPNVQGQKNWTALHIASQNGGVDVARTLLECGADPNIPTDHKSTSLHVASAWGNLDIVRLLLQHNSEIHAKDNDGCTPLQRASERRSPRRDVIEFLLANGANDPTR